MTLLFCLFLCCVWGDFFNTKDEGWHFYHDHRHTQKEHKRDKPKTMKELREQAQLFLETAVFNPTPQNVMRYQRLQKYIMEKSERFARVWTANLLSEPDLDNTVIAPTSYYGIVAKKENVEKQRQADLKIIAQNFALVLLVDETYLSQKLHTVVSAMAKTHKLPLMIVDVRTNPEEPKIKWGIKRIPALVMVSLKDGRPLIITYKLSSQDEMEAQMVTQMRGDLL